MEQNQANNDPSVRRSMQNSSVNDARVSEEVEALFGGGKSAHAQVPSADDFISRTARSKVAIVVPLFGYWSDVKNGYLDEEILEACLVRARSYAHSAYIILLAEPQRLLQSTARIINKQYVAGNAKGVAMPNGSSYGDYVRKGMQVALEETDAQYFIFVNPWMVIQDHGIDTLIDRINIPDNAPVICGFDIRPSLTAKAGGDQEIAGREFLSYKATVPEEIQKLNFNFFGLNRYIAEMCPLDPDLKTQPYLERDFFQSVGSKGYNAVCSERVPIFSFDFDWSQYISNADYEADKTTFKDKWHFVPEDVKHE